MRKRHNELAAQYISWEKNLKGLEFADTEESTGYPVLSSK